MARLPDEQWAMIEDSIDKKRTAASAFKQRSHCGKSGCSLPSDFRTKKELNAMNGEVKSYRLNAPMSWDEFKEMPNDLRVTYIQSLRDKFNVPDQHIAEMFDVSLAKLTLYLLDLKMELVHNTEIWNKEAFLAWRTGANTELVKENEAVEETKYKYAPIDWATFKTKTDAEKVAYIQWVRETFGAPEGNIASVFGINRTTFSRWCNELGCGLGKGAGGNKSSWDSTEFDAWVRGEKAVEEILEIVSEPAVEVEADVEIAKTDIKTPAEIVPESRPEPVRAIPTFGELDFNCPADQALNTLAMLLGNNHVRMSVHWDIVKES